MTRKPVSKTVKTPLGAAPVKRASAAPAKRRSAAAAARAGTAPAKRAGGQANVHPHPAVAYRLHALLHTMHSIEHHEDQLCTLLTAIEREGAVSPALGRELAALLEELPGQAFVADLEAARKAVAPPARAASKRKGA